MKNTYFNTLYLLALILLGLLFFLSISRDAAAEGTYSDTGYTISPWGVVIGGLLIIMLLMYFQVRKKFRNRFPKS